MRTVGSRACLLLGALLCLCAAAACDPEPDDERSGELSLDDLLAALDEPGKVFYAESEREGLLDTGDRLDISKTWYWADEGVGRKEYWTDGRLQSATIFAAGQATTLEVLTNRLDRDVLPAFPMLPDEGALALEYVTFWLLGDTGGGAPVTTRETVEGGPLLVGRFERTLTDTGSDSPPGTVQTFAVRVDEATLLPHSWGIEIRYPGDDRVYGETWTYTTTACVEPSTLPDDFFDPDALAGRQITFDEALDLAANAGFPVYWPGPAIPVAWTAPTGTTVDQQELLTVLAPGYPGVDWPNVVLRYGPGDSIGPGLLLIRQTAVPGWEPVPQSEVAAMEAAGNLDRDGADLYYTWYFSRSGCTAEEAQGEDDCRLDAPSRMGAIVERGGTRIHLEATSLSGPAGNPFSHVDALKTIVGSLVVLEP